MLLLQIRVKRYFAFIMPIIKPAITAETAIETGAPIFTASISITVLLNNKTTTPENQTKAANLTKVAFVAVNKFLVICISIVYCRSLRWYQRLG